ncbi:AEC family transporter [Pseudomonas sp. UBA4194]|uniref:AEC family transporter n=1 Tax=Pseudomonas sp. UBA4194 TaxID=1947317 RepID=UPI0025EE1B6B|nr:AEC family transporter [Pseudomonas sp. UBA4194]
MLAIFNVAFPVFGLILIGFVCRRRNILGPNASTELNRFVIYLGLPSLLFEAMARLGSVEALNLGYILSFALGMAVVFLLTLWLRLRHDAHFIDATVDALGAAYPNAGFLGIPLCLLTFGQQAIAPGVIGVLMTACVLFAIAIIMIETSRQTEKHLGRTLAKVGGSLLRNPIMVAPVLGSLVAWSGVALPTGVQQLFNFLGGAAGPCALVSIGLFLAATESRRADNHTLWMLVAMKLLLQPALTAVLAFWVFDMPPMWAWSALLLSALPIGNGPFMLAALFGREADTMSRAILVSTLLSLVTVSLILAWIPAM